MPTQQPPRRRYPPASFIVAGCASKEEGAEGRQRQHGHCDATFHLLPYVGLGVVEYAVVVKT